MSCRREREARDESESLFESVYDETSERWTLRRISRAPFSGVSPVQRCDERQTIAVPAEATTPTVSPEAEVRRETPRIEAPSSLAIPVRAISAVEETLDLRIAFLLAHIDGQSTILEIAAIVDRPLDEVSSAIGVLAAMGLVELIGNVTRMRVR